MKYDALVPIDIRGLDSLALDVVVCKMEMICYILFYDILFKVLEIYIQFIIFCIEVSLLL